MSEGQRHIRRHRPQGNVLVIWLATIAGVGGVVMAVALVLLFTKVSTVANDAHQAASKATRSARAATLAVQRINTSRHDAALLACQNIESLKGGLRLILSSFHVNEGDLPPNPATGRPPLAPIPGGCVAYANSVARP